MNKDQYFSFKFWINFSHFPFELLLNSVSFRSESRFYLLNQLFTFTFLVCIELEVLEEKILKVLCQSYVSVLCQSYVSFMTSE
jgi:hypothetical protein